MKFFRKGKDGGPHSTVTGYWLAEIKKLFSVVLLKFEDGSRDEFHSHAFNSWNWVLKGLVIENVMQDEEGEGDYVIGYKPSVFPIFTSRDRFHKVVSHGTTWVFSIRGPWAKTWEEWDPKTEQYTVLTHGRKIV